MNSGYFVAVLVSLSCSAMAQVSTTSLSTTTVSTTSTVEATPQSAIKTEGLLGNKKFEDDKDITDSKLKADSGSLSRYSLKVSLSLYGPPVGDLSNKKQPNPDGTISSNYVSIGGSLSGRYRIDSKSAVSVGTGVTALTPFHGVERTDVKTPFISYDRNARWGELQARNSYGVSITTIPEFRGVAQYANLSYDNSMVYNIGTSGFAVGVDTGLNYYLFEREYIKADKKISRYTLGFYPQIKYNFSDKVNVYTSLALNFWNPRYSDEAELLNKKLSGRLGMGWAIKRDIYFAPYLNFYPDQLTADSTTFSFSTIFSVL